MKDVARRIAKTFERHLEGGTPLPAAVLHPNGFIRIDLLKHSDTDPVTRLHVWLPLSEDGDIHDHSADMSSVILAGRIQEARFNADGSEGPFTQFRYFSRAQGGDGSLLQLGRATVVPASVRTYQAGDEYEILHSTLHRVSNPYNQLALTLVTKHRYHRPFSNIFRDDATKNVVDSGPAPLKDVLESLELALRIMRQIESQGHCRF